MVSSSLVYSYYFSFGTAKYKCINCNTIIAVIIIISFIVVV